MPYGIIGRPYSFDLEKKIDFARESANNSSPSIYPPPSPLPCSQNVQKQAVEDRGEKIRIKKKGSWNINQGFDGNQTKVGRLKVTNIENNKVALSY